MWKVNAVAALMLYRIIGIDLGDFEMFCCDGICFWNCVPNVVQISHIIAENDIHLFRGLLSVGDRPVRKFCLKWKKITAYLKKT